MADKKSIAGRMKTRSLVRSRKDENLDCRVRGTVRFESTAWFCQSGATIAQLLASFSDKNETEKIQLYLESA